MSTRIEHLSLSPSSPDLAARFLRSRSVSSVLPSPGRRPSHVPLLFQRSKLYITDEAIEELRTQYEEQSRTLNHFVKLIQNWVGLRRTQISEEIKLLGTADAALSKQKEKSISTCYSLSIDMLARTCQEEVDFLDSLQFAFLETVTPFLDSSKMRFDDLIFEYEDALSRLQIALKCCDKLQKKACKSWNRICSVVKKKSCNPKLQDEIAILINACKKLVEEFESQKKQASSISTEVFGRKIPMFRKQIQALERERSDFQSQKMIRFAELVEKKVPTCSALKAMLLETSLDASPESSADEGSGAVSISEVEAKLSFDPRFLDLKPLELFEKLNSTGILSNTIEAPVHEEKSQGEADVVVVRVIKDFRIAGFICTKGRLIHVLNSQGSEKWMGVLLGPQPGAPFWFSKSCVEMIPINISIEMPHLLQLPSGKLSFRAFLKTQHSLENLDFVDEVSLFSQTSFFSEKDMSHAAKRIIDKYVSDEAVALINVVPKLRAAVVTCWAEDKIDHFMFDSLTSEVYRMMNTDIFPRFKTSAQFHKFLSRYAEDN